MLFDNTDSDGSSFQVFRKLNGGKLFVDAILWAGTYKSSSLQRANSGLCALFDIHVSLKENGNLAGIKSCINFNFEILINSSRGMIPDCLNKGDI
jgi:hypothetical protein